MRQNSSTQWRCYRHHRKVTQSHSIFLNSSSKVKHFQFCVSRKMGFGDYPAEYNPAKHGPYDPARWYGKRKY